MSKRKKKELRRTSLPKGELVEMTSEMLSKLRPGPLQHKKGLSPLLTRFARELFQELGHLQCPTFEQWEIGFMRDLWPWREILTWETILRVYRAYFTKHPDAPRGRETVGLIVSVSTGVILKGKNAAKGRELRSLWLEANQQRWTPLLGEPTEWDPEKAKIVPLEAILEEHDGVVDPNLRGDPQHDVRRFLTESQVVLGKDAHSEDPPFILHGRELLREMGAEDTIPYGVATLVIVLENRDELHKACAVLQLVKGSHDLLTTDS